ncbi:MAG: electron transport complex subunit RsxB [Rudaea sp.]|nr:electron transport complex subunit RsxB [Rudaea sp.]
MHVSVPATSLADRIDALLPQTQCTRCGYPACRPYAEAIARGEADINHCPPGGAAGIEALAELLGRAAKPLDPLNGCEKPRAVALIDEEVCIGCTKCILACPVDAIIGAAKMMHTVLVDECTGCELCIAPCPVDCISMAAAGADNEDSGQRAAQYRARYVAHSERLAREESERAAELAMRKAALDTGANGNAVLAAIARARAKKSGAAKP